MEYIDGRTGDQLRGLEERDSGTAVDAESDAVELVVDVCPGD